MKTSIILSLLILLLASCGKSTKVVIPQPSTTAFKADTNLSGKLFLIGPMLDSSKVEITAGCDCCTSDFAFLTDSTFVFVSNCVHGNEYFKGKYISYCNTLLVKFDSRYINTSWQIDEGDTLIHENPDLKLKIIIGNDGESYNALRLSTLKSKTVISACYDASCEYGVVNKNVSLERFIHRLKSDEIWKKLQPEK